MKRILLIFLLCFVIPFLLGFTKYTGTVLDRVTGKVVSAVNVTVYKTGTTTKATIFADRNGTPLANPVSSDSKGKVWFYAADGDYDLSVSGTEIANYILSQVSISKFHEEDVTYYTSFAEAITAIGAAHNILLIPNSQTVSSDVIIPSNITLKFVPGGQLLIANGATVTCNGHIDAGLYKVFSLTGRGKIVFGPGSIKEVYPQWWGAKGNGVSDDTTAIQNAINSLSPPSEGGTLFFPTGTYIVKKPLVYTGSSAHRISLIGASAGAGTHGSVLKWDGATVSTTGNTDGSTDVVTNISDTSNLNIGDYVTVSAGLPSLYGAYGAYADVYKILNKTSSTITLETNSNSAQSGVTVEQFGILFRANGGNGYVSHLTFEGNSKAKQCFDIESGGFYGGAPANHWVIEDCVFRGASGTKSAQLCLGRLICQQTSETKVNNSQFLGVIGSVYGVICGIGNAKNFQFYGCNFAYNQIGIDLGSGNQASIVASQFEANTLTDIGTGPSQLMIHSCGSEGSGRFIDGLYGSVAPGVSIMNCYWDSANTNTDDFVVHFPVNLLVGNNFKNSRTPTSIPKMRVVGAGLGDKPSIVSIGNYFKNCTPYDNPFYFADNRGWSKDYTGLNSYPMRILSFGDYGSTSQGFVNLEIGTYSFFNIGPNKHAWGTTAPTGRDTFHYKTWRKGDVIYNSNPSAGNPMGWVCVASGTFSTATDSSGRTTSGSPTITNMSTITNFQPGDYVTVSAGFPSSSTPYEIIGKTSTSLTLDKKATSNQSNVTVASPDPVFKAMANLAP